jgi:hypothetical protein
MRWVVHIMDMRRSRLLLPCEFLEESFLKRTDRSRPTVEKIEKTQQNGKKDI